MKNDWQTKKLEDIVLTIQSGFACGKSKSVPVGVPHLRTFNIETSGKLNLSHMVYIPKTLVKNGFGLENGDILFNNTNSKELVGKSAFVEQDLPYSFSNHLTRIKVDQKQILPRWLLYVLIYLWQKGYFMSQSVKWIGQAGYSSQRLKSLEIPLLPIEEQEKIVLKLDNIFSKVAEAKSIQKNNQGRTKILFTALFKQLVSGVAKKSKRLRLGDVLVKIQYGTSSRASGGNLPILRMSNLKDGSIDYSTLKYIQLPQNEVRKYLLEKGDILINRTNSLELVGKAGYFDKDELFVFASYLIRLVVDKEKADAKFVNFWINSQFGREYVLKIARQTAGQANINSKEIADIPILLPFLEDQKRIIIALENLSAKINNVQYLQEKTQSEFEILTQSVLGKTFQN